MLYNPHFFYSKCRLFHNATLFGFCITHILNTRCAKIWKKKIRRQKVKVKVFLIGEGQNEFLGMDSQNQDFCEIKGN